jgi:hypothetical protein
VSKSSPVSGQSFLDEHRATLVPDDFKWLLTYPIAGHEYGERTPERVEVTLPIVARSYNDALIIAEVILREHLAPATPSPATPTAPAAKSVPTLDPRWEG